MSTKQETDIISIAGQIGINILWEGPPGSGKSAMVYEIAKNLKEKTGEDWVMHTLYGSRIKDDTDLCGLYDISGDYVRFKHWKWAVELANASRGILFIDETNQTEFQAVLLGLLQDKRIGDLDLSHIMMIGACNASHEGVNVIPLQPPTANRFLHIERKVDHESIQQWLDQIKTGELDFRVDVPIVPTDWKKYLKKWAVRVGTFFEVKPSMVHVIPKEEKARSKAFPTFRSNENMIKMLAACESVGLDKDTTELAISGLVGYEVSSAFFTYNENLDLTAPEEVFKNIQKWKVPKKSDTAYVMLFELTEYYRAHNDNYKNLLLWEAMWDIIDKYTDAERKDLACPFVVELSKMINTKTLLPTPKQQILKPYLELNAEIKRLEGGQK